MSAKRQKLNVNCIKQRVHQKQRSYLLILVKLNRKCSFEKNFLPILKRFTVGELQEERYFKFNFQNSIWTFKIRIIKQKLSFYVISETSATGIWGSLYFGKHQVLHWLLWQWLYLEFHTQFSPKLVNLLLFQGRMKEAEKSKNVSTILFWKFFFLQDTKTMWKKGASLIQVYRVSRHFGVLGTIIIDTPCSALLILNFIPIQRTSFYVHLTYVAGSSYRFKRSMPQIFLNLQWN